MTADIMASPYSDAIERGKMARKWRERTINLSRRELGEAIGLKESQLQDLETGIDRKRGTPIPEETFNSFALKCAIMMAPVVERRRIARVRKKLATLEQAALAKFTWGKL